MHNPVKWSSLRFCFVLLIPLRGLCAETSWWDAYECDVGMGGIHLSAAQADSVEGGVVGPASPIRPWTFGEKDRLIVPHGDKLNLAGPVTIEVWCKPAAHSGYALLKKHAFGFPAFLPDGDVSWYLYTADKKTYGVRCKDAAKLGHWRQYCLVVDGKHTIAYVDAKEANRRAVASRINTPANPMMIGFSDGWAGKFLGEIGLVRLYDTALSPAQIADNRKRLEAGLYPTTSAHVVFERSALPRTSFTRAFIFDDENAPIEMPVSDGFHPQRTMLVGAWINPAETRDPGPVITHGNGHNAGFQLILYGTTLAGVIKTTDGKFWVRQTECVEPGRWQNIGLAWNGRTLQLLKDGKPVGKPGLATGTLVATDQPLRVGTAPGGTRRYRGEVAEIRLLDDCQVDLPDIPQHVGEEAHDAAVNDDPSGTVGPRSRHLEGKTEKRTPLVDFEDMTGWQVAYGRGITAAKLMRSREQRCWAEHVAKIVYGGGEYQGIERKVRILPPEPIEIRDRFDAIDLWTYPHYWGRGQGVAMTVHLQDADGVDHEFDLAANPRWFYWTGWYIAHRKLPRAFEPGTLFTGFTLHSFADVPEQVMYLDSLAFYVEDRSPIDSHVPAWDDLPCPTTQDTILPSLPPDTRYVNTAARASSVVLMSYQGPHDRIEWRYQPDTGTLSDIKASFNGGPAFRPAAFGWRSMASPIRPTTRPSRNASSISK